MSTSKPISMRQRLLLSKYMKGFAAGADLTKQAKHVLNQDKEMEQAWRRGHAAGRQAAHSAEDLEERTLLGEIDPPGKANI